MNKLFPRRIGAYLIDIAALFLVLGPLGLAVQRLLGLSPATARGVYIALVLNFSIPVWAYFTLADRSRGGATLGKRLLSLRTEGLSATSISSGQAVRRTAVKMIPWELTHASLFLFAPALGQFETGNWVGLGLSYALSFLYLLVAWRTRGHRSVHDFVAASRVRLVARSPNTSSTPHD